MIQFDPVLTHLSLPGMLTIRRRKLPRWSLKNGQVHAYYGVTPEDWANYRSPISPGKGFQTYIKRDPATGAGRTSRPLTATSAQSRSPRSAASQRKRITRKVYRDILKCRLLKILLAL